MIDVKSIENRLEDVEKRLNSLESRFDSDAQKSNQKERKKMSVREFLLRLQVTSHTERVLAMAFYLEEHLGINEFNIDEIRSLYREAKEPSPSNINDIIYKLIKRWGYLMEVDSDNGKKRWTITNSGNDQILGKIEE